MSQPESKKFCEPIYQRDHQTLSNNSLLIQCADLVLPWLNPKELAATSSTCKSLRQISKSITLRRSSDSCRAFESFPIPFHNSVDHQPYAFFIYTPSLISSSSSFSSSQFPRRQSWGSSSAEDDKWVGRQFAIETVRLVDESGERVSGCGCQKCGEEEEEGDGFGNRRCPCLRFDGFEDVVSECGPSCCCGFECPNRVTQRGVSVRLKIVKDERKGWGLYADQLIPEGQFICEYAGELLTTKEARRRQQMYDELALGGHFSPALLVVREHLPSGNSCLRFNIDATVIGNVARFINHSCDGGNLTTTLVRSSGSLIPRLCLYASEDIKKDEELTFSYGGIRLHSKGLQCFCGSSCCFGSLPSEQT